MNRLPRLLFLSSCSHLDSLKYRIGAAKGAAGAYFAMALDQQRNWDYAMADNLAQIKRRAAMARMPIRSITILEAKVDSAAVEEPEFVNTRDPVYLPDEIILQTLSYVACDSLYQPTFYTCCLLSRQWYAATVPLLYERPQLEGRRFDPFVRAICPSINLHVRVSPLSRLVKVLDMGRLVHHGSKSLTARLLGRTKDSLEVFIAPQASFAISCYPALSKCSKLRVLDLSLVSESTPLQTLFNTVKSLKNLETLRLPRSSGFGTSSVDADLINWPPNLQRLYLAGGIDAHFLYGIVNFPLTLHELTIEHCPQAKGHAVRQLLATMSAAEVPLVYLRIAYMPKFSINALDIILAFFPDLEDLSVSIDYITPAILNPEFQEYHDVIRTPDFSTHALRALELTNSGSPGDVDKFSPLDVIIALDEGSFPHLRTVRVAKSLQWGTGDTRQEMDALDEQLQLLELEDYKEKKAMYADMSADEWRATDWRKNAGVWTIDG